MTKLTEDHKRKISEGVKLSRRRFLQGSAATGLAATTGGQELLSSTTKPSTGLLKATLSTGADTSALALNRKLTRRQFLREILIKPIIRTPRTTLENISKTGKIYGKGLLGFVDPVGASLASSGVKTSGIGKIVRMISRVIS